MKTLHILKNVRQAVLIDENTGKATAIDYSPTDIDYMYVTPEDVRIQYTDGAETKILEATKGDLIIKFYSRSYIKNPVVVVKNHKWKENIIQMEAEKKKRECENEACLKTASIKHYCPDCCDDSCC